MAGDGLVSHQGERVVVYEVGDTHLWETVYNMRIADFHTYFVGCEEGGFDVWAHNTGVCVFETTPGKWTIVAEDGTVLAQDLAASDAQALANFYNSHPTIGPGPFAEESITAQSSAQVFEDAERIQGNHLFDEFGCHSCGTSNPGTLTGNCVLDHQPPTALNVSGLPQVLYPQCLSCSSLQGLTIWNQWLRIKRP